MEFIVFVYGVYFFLFIRYIIRNETGIFRQEWGKVQPTFYDYCNTLFNDKIVFYKQLDAKNKEKFVFRVHEFIKSKEWKGFYDFEVESEHRALIAACAVQLTFGLKEYKLEHIKRIFIAPEIFYSRLFERDVKGLTMYNAVYLSWEDCQKGIDLADDAYNLCLHEFAHALDMTMKVDGADVDEHYANFLYAWDEQSDRVFELMNHDEEYKGFLREYAKVNKHEFFAVCVEHFFERSESFRNADHKLYATLCNLLNLNPQNVKNNFALEKSFLLQEKISVSNGRFNLSLKWAGFMAAASFLLVYYYPFRIILEHHIFIALAANYFIYSATHIEKTFYSTEHLLKIAGIYLLGLFPFFLILLSVFLPNAKPI